MFGFDMNKHKENVKMSAFDILSTANYGVGGADMAKAYGLKNSLLDKGFTIFDRVKTEALYERPVALQGGSIAGMICDFLMGRHLAPAGLYSYIVCLAFMPLAPCVQSNTPSLGEH